MNNIKIEGHKIDLIVLENGRTIKLPIEDELTITCESSNHKEIQSMDVILSKGKIVTMGNLISKLESNTVNKYNKTFLPQIGDKVYINLEGIKKGIIKAFIDSNEVIISINREFKNVHVSELIFISRKKNFLKYFF